VARVSDFNEDGAPDLLACNRASQSVTRQLAGCPSVLSHALAIVSPNGAETWVGDTTAHDQLDQGRRRDDRGPPALGLERRATGARSRAGSPAPDYATR
jgi:hypothetical protein